MSVLTGVCPCGVDVERVAAEGLGAHILNEMTLLCPSCSVKEEERREALELARQNEEDCAKHRTKLEVLPVALRGATLADLDTEGRDTALDAARRWAAGELLGLVLLGAVGRGKTTIAAATVSSYIAQHLDRAAPRWINATLAFSNLARGFRDSERIDTINVLTGKQSPLVLDDIDKGKPNTGAAEALFLAIDLAMTNRRPLIVTTNLMPSELVKSWPRPHGEAIVSRLAGYCEMHRVTGLDRRLQAAAA